MGRIAQRRHNGAHLPTSRAPQREPSSSQPPPTPVPDVPNNLSGHLQARPTIVVKGKIIKVYWNIANVSSCTVTGTNGDTWSGATSGNPGKTSSAINQQTMYTLSCTALDSSTYQESTAINLVSAYQEK